MPTSTATCISWPNAANVFGSLRPTAPCSTSSAGTTTLSSTTEPLNVARWPNASQSCPTCTPGAVRGTYAITVASSSSCAKTGIHCAVSAPVA